MFTIAESRKHATVPMDPPGFNPPFEDSLAKGLAEAEPGVVYVVQEKQWPAVKRSIGALGGHQLVRLGEPYRQRIFFTVTVR